MNEMKNAIESIYSRMEFQTEDRVSFHKIVRREYWRKRKESICNLYDSNIVQLLE